MEILQTPARRFSVPESTWRIATIFMAVVAFHICIIVLLVISRHAVQPKQKQGSLSVFALAAAPSPPAIQIPDPVIPVEAIAMISSPAEMGEIRGAEAMSWLRAVGTGHPGSITTVHANSTRGASEQLALMALMSGAELRRSELVEYISDVVDIFIQLGRHNGDRLVTEIDFSGRAEIASGTEASVRLIEGRRFGS